MMAKHSPACLTTTSSSSIVVGEVAVASNRSEVAVAVVIAE